MRFTTDSKNVWIKDQFHDYYSRNVKILDATEEGYKAQVELGTLININEGPVIFLKEDQVTDSLMGD